MTPPFDELPSFTFTTPPDTTWKLGEGLKDDGGGMASQWKEDEKLGWKTLKMDEMEKVDIYKMLTSAVVPRPVAFVSTLSPSGEPNLAPFSYFSLISHDPPLITVSFTISPRRPKDTRENIKSTKEFVVNIISEPFVEAANSTSVESPADIDEWIVSGLTQEPSSFVKPPRVRESAVSFECELYHFLDLTPPGSTVVTGTLAIGHIRAAHIRNAVLAEGSGTTVDPAKLRAVSRLGGTTFARVGPGFEIPRPSWREIDGEVRDLMKKKEEGKL